MSHLHTERLAALASEAPTAWELAHLRGCAECAREREAYQQLSAMAQAERDRIGVPLTSWDRLTPALERDLAAVPAERWRGGAWGRVAAAILFVAAGASVGRYFAPRPVTPPLSQERDAASGDSAVRFASLEDALKAQAWSRSLYQQATAFVAQHDTATKSEAESPAVMRTRLAALDRVLETTGAALNQAPYDPVINGYYLTTLGQREATLRQLRTSMPVGVRITSY